MQEREESVRRLRNAAGPLEGLIKMVERDASWVDVMRQIQAVQASLGKMNTHVLENHLRSCVATAMRGDRLDDRERVLREIADVFEVPSRV
ncbi:MAG: metal-sensing transcriptional repressor [Anaerolineales bacterium]|jgi:DNA-binding FrmR family transcriptional regulator